MNKLVKTAFKFGKKKATKTDTAKKVGLWVAKATAGTAIWVGLDHAAQRSLDAILDRTVEDRTVELELRQTHLAAEVSELHKRMGALENGDVINVNVN